MTNYIVRVTLVDYETVEGLTGLYNNCAKVTVESLSATDSSVTYTETYWYAPNVGLVKYTAQAPGQAADVEQLTGKSG